MEISITTREPGSSHRRAAGRSEAERRANLLTLRYVPGHYQCLVPDGPRPTLAELLGCLEALMKVPLVAADTGELLSAPALRASTGQALSELLLTASAHPAPGPVRPQMVSRPACCASRLAA